MKTFRHVLIIFAVLTVMRETVSLSGHRRLRSVLGAIFESRPSAATNTVTSCTGCIKKFLADEVKSNNLPESPRYSVTEQELMALRIEYIKNQILKKLRLKEKPTVLMADLPKPVIEDESLLPRTYGESVQKRYSDDFYGKTTQAIIFPYEDDLHNILEYDWMMMQRLISQSDESPNLRLNFSGVVNEARCVRKIRNPSACLPFQMPSDVEATDVSSAELWFHKEPDIFDSHNQTFVISEVAHWDTKKSFQKMKPIAIQETDLSEGWLKIDVAYVVKNWLQYQESPTRAINVACKTCGMDIHRSPISFKQSHKPFLVIYTHSQQRTQVHRRLKRHSNCEGGLNECCRESLYVSFEEIGWKDWIIHPDGYNAYFCKGSCATAASVTLSATQHNSILQKVMYGPNRSSATRLELTPCCAATQFQSLQLFYRENNKTITSKILPNMIVDSCGCM